MAWLERLAVRLELFAVLSSKKKKVALTFSSEKFMKELAIMPPEIRGAG